MCVNGLKLIHMQIRGTIQGINFTYFGYYYSDKGGSTQLVAYTGTNMAQKYKMEIEDFLNGFVVR